MLSQLVKLFLNITFHILVPKPQDGGMYKAPAYSGYPFLMLPDPYHPNGQVPPSVSFLLSFFIALITNYFGV